MNRVKLFKWSAKCRIYLILASYVVVISCLSWLQCSAFVISPRIYPKSAKVRREIADIKLATEAFHSQYFRWPMTTEAIRAGKPDFTFGNWQIGKINSLLIVNDGGKGYQANNSEALVILMSERHSVYNHQFRSNPQKKFFLTPARENEEEGKPGIGPSRVFLDPWGNPYIISLDVDEDGWTQDAFYSRAKVSAMFAKGAKGLHGLESRMGKGADDFALHGTVMIWSFGPDGKADPNIGADEGVNRDNILSWR